jgi:hypothetical protein
MEDKNDAYSSITGYRWKWTQDFERQVVKSGCMPYLQKESVVSTNAKHVSLVKQNRINNILTPTRRPTNSSYKRLLYFCQSHYFLTSHHNSSRSGCLRVNLQRNAKFCQARGSEGGFQSSGSSGSCISTLSDFVLGMAAVVLSFRSALDGGRL